MMENLVYKNMDQLKKQMSPSGWTGINIPEDLERETGIWVTKAGARNFPGGFHYSPEKNSHWEWGAILDGSFEFEYGGGNIKAERGSSYIMASDVAMTARSVGNPFLVWVEISGPVASSAIRKLGGKGGELILSRFSYQQVKSILKIAHLLHEHPYGYNILVNSYLWSFLADSANLGSTASKQISPDIQKSIDFITGRGSLTKCTLDKLSQISGLSVETFRKKFQGETGESPIKYLLRHQIKKAKELLSQKDLNVKQVASQVGFDDQYYFSRLFRKYEGLSPTEFRRRFYPELFF